MAMVDSNNSHLYPIAVMIDELGECFPGEHGACDARYDGGQRELVRLVT